MYNETYNIYQVKDMDKELIEKYPNENITDLINSNSFDYKKINSFKKNSFNFLDGNSMERFIQRIFKAQHTI